MKTTYLLLLSVLGFISLSCAAEPTAGDTLDTVTEASKATKSGKVQQRAFPGGAERKGTQPKPFLMAGDPRFEQMLELALVDEGKITEAIQKWPRVQKMSEPEKRKFIRRVTRFREKLRQDAMQEADRLGLHIPAEKQVEYLRKYWESRMQLEQEIREQALNQHKTKMMALREELQQEWAD